VVAAIRSLAFLTVPATDGSGPLGDLAFSTDTVLIFPGGKAGLTVEGGFAIKLVNKTGAPSVKGTCVEAGGGVALGFVLATTGAGLPIGFVYEDGIADGSGTWVVMRGIGYAKLENDVATTQGNWCRTSSTVAGRIETAVAHPGNTVAHFFEVGHALESVSADAAGALVRIAIHTL
jgi:hypothetical protein